MREELDQFIGATWGECTPKRKGYRNGHYTRDLVTSTGRLEDLQVPRDRAGQFHTQAFERYSRYEPHIARSDSPRCLWPGQARDIRGRSGPNVAGSRSKSAAPSVASTRPWLNNLKRGDNARGLEHWRILYLDGIHFSMRHGDKADATIILTALGVDLAGNKEVLARPRLRRGKQGRMDQPAARCALTRSHPD
jgi:putative transposase